MPDLEKRTAGYISQRALGYIKDNPHMVLSACLFCGGSASLRLDLTPLAGSLFGAGGALLGAWFTELNKRRADAVDKKNREANAVAALAPELQRTIERVRFILDRSVVNFACESAVDETKPNDLQTDFRPYLPTLYPNAPQVRDLPGAKALALIRYYDSLNEISQHVDDWWEREGQLAVNIFNGIKHAGEEPTASHDLHQRVRSGRAFPTTLQILGLADIEDRTVSRQFSQGITVPFGPGGKAPPRPSEVAAAGALPSILGRGASAQGHKINSDR
jgi:hypothetical protein